MGVKLKKGTIIVIFKTIEFTENFKENIENCLMCPPYSKCR